METDRDVETSYSKSEFIAELRRLADALESNGGFTIEVDGEEISVPEDATFTVEHEREDGREELEFQLVWGGGEVQDQDEDDESEETGEEESAKKDTSVAA